MKKNHVRTGILIAVVVLVPALVLAQQQPRFEAVLSGARMLGCVIILPVGFQAVEWVNPDRVEEDSDVLMVASSPGLPVFAVRSGDIVTLQPDGTYAPFANPTFNPLAITVAPTGRVFTASNGPTLTVFSPAGVEEASYPLPGLDQLIIAAAPDGCTIYYDKAGAIGRINGCTGAVLPDFASGDLEWLFDIYPLLNGQVLIAIDNGVRLYDAAGNFVRNVADVSLYGFDSQYFPLQVATTPDSQILYLAISDGCSDAFLVRASMRDDGRELSRRPIQVNAANGLVIGAASTMDAPTASEAALMLLAVVLGLSGVLLLRR